ncbi:MAG: low-specificity L-threonine aldolase [Anaerolineales bacterium]|nr:low-specificity L-threonine aldolase [Anaerolineales bacterium]
MKTNKILDFRSDTVTLPTDEMRAAMAVAPVGDDVYKEDPTVNRLQQISAEITGMDAALLVPSGTMGNLASLLAHCQRGQEIIVGRKAHIFLYEAAGAAALGGINIQTIPNQPDGTLKLEDIQAAIRPKDEHQPITRLVALENTHNRCNGISLSPEYTRQVADFVHARNLILHIDGARIFNAAIDLNVSVAQLASPADSVTFCLSKGLSAPVGSVICGSEEFIYKAHRIRKQLGGGMRQAGILAAAGIVALENMVERLEEDHRNARLLALGLAEIPSIAINPAEQHTNMVYFSLIEGSPVSLKVFREQLASAGLLVSGGPDRIRMVTHAWVDQSHVEQAIKIITTLAPH